MQQYTPSNRFTNVNYMMGNHFKFLIDGLSDFTQYVQGVILPSIGVPVANSPNPFTKIPQVGDHIDFGSIDVDFKIDANFLTYFSIFAWLRGYGFPNSFEDIAAFQEARRKQIANVRPTRREIEKTNATLYLLAPDTDTTIAEIHFYDIFPTALGQVKFDTTAQDAPSLNTQATFFYTNFEITLTN